MAEKTNTRDMMEEERARRLNLEKERIQAEEKQRKERRLSAKIAFDLEKQRIIEEQADEERKEKQEREKRRQLHHMAAEEERKRQVAEQFAAQAEEERQRLMNEEAKKKYEEEKASYERHCAIIQEQEVERQRRILEAQEILNKIKAEVATHEHDGDFEVEAIYDYSGHEEHLLSFKKGDRVTVKQVSETGWWTGELNGKVGPFPSNYVTKVAE